MKVREEEEEEEEGKWPRVHVFTSRGCVNEKCSGGKRADIFPGEEGSPPLMPPYPGGVDNGFERVCAPFVHSPRAKVHFFDLRPSAALSWTFVSWFDAWSARRRGYDIRIELNFAFSRQVLIIFGF